MPLFFNVFSIFFAWLLYGFQGPIHIIHVGSLSFNFKRTHENSTEFGLRCDTNIGISENPSVQWSDIARMEWQARTIAPKILMPRKAAIRKIDELYNDRLHTGANLTDAEEISTVIKQLSDFFGVSKQSAAIRMMELGHPEAEQFCDGSAKPSSAKHSRNNSRAQSHLQTITASEAFQLYMKSDFLRATIDTGAFCFANGFFVLRDEKYVLYGADRKFMLTDYAKLHLHECALDFSTRLIADPYLMHDATAHLMFRADTRFQRESGYDNSPQNTELYNKAKEFERKFSHSKATHKTASELLKGYMDAAHWNVTTFQSATQLDAMTYSRVQNNYQKFTLRPLITMGYSLGLDVAEMEEVLNAAGLSFNPTNEESQAYKFIFTAFPDRDIEECNAFLKEKGFHLLGSQERKRA